MAQIIDGKAVAAQVRAQAAQEAAELTTQGTQPGLAVVIVGDDPASRIYVNNKKKACAEVGVYSEEHALPAGTSQDALLALIRQLNQDPKIHGILVQSPLPEGLDEAGVVEAIAPEKDVDAFHAYNVGKIMQGRYHFLVIGRSDIVGKPMAMLLLHQNGTVTICHSKTRNLPEICRRADILVSAVGRAGFVTGNMIKPGAVVIDVGMNRDANGKLCGDVVFEEADKLAAFLTPVPGGVGPMTIAMLMRNTVTAAKLALGLSR